MAKSHHRLVGTLWTSRNSMYFPSENYKEVNGKSDNATVETEPEW